MLKDAPIGSPIFHIYNVLYLTVFTGLMTFGMLFVYYITYEPPNHLKDVEKMLGKDVSKYTIIQDDMTVDDLSNLKENNKYLNGYPSVRRFYITDTATNEPVMTVFDIASGGFGGLVWSLVGVDGLKVKAISVYNTTSETAGLGQRVEEIGFQRQFLNKTLDQLPKDRSEWVLKDIDMISGATFSSTSVVESIMKSFHLYNVGEN